MSHAPLGKLSVARTAVLKHTMRSMHRMMQSSGTSEGLRGLLDSSLLKSVKKVLQNRAIFGPSVLGLGMQQTFDIYVPSAHSYALHSHQHHVYFRAQRANVPASHPGNWTPGGFLQHRREGSRASHRGMVKLHVEGSAYSSVDRSFNPYRMLSALCASTKPVKTS